MSGTVKVHAPVEGYKGTVAGVDFTDGVGEVERGNRSALGYFARHGYGIGGKPKADDTPEPPDPRKVGFLGSGIDQAGTHLRDAAVDPRPEDFLPPTNAGEANPHGPEVVAPEIHASQGVRPIKGGDVHVGDPDAQQEAETAHAVTVLTEGTDAVTAAPEGERPAKSANKPEWVDFAVSQGADRGEAEATSKGDLIDIYGGDA